MYRSAQFSEKYGAANKRKDEDEAKDEVLVRANGIPTYFAADIAYHYNKLAVRGFDKAIDVWGADHHGHVARMKGAMDAVGLDGAKLDVVLMQLVKLVRDGQPVRMSKRTGKAITLTDLLTRCPSTAPASSSICGRRAARWNSTWIWPSRRTATTRCTMCSTPTPVSAPS